MLMGFIFWYRGPAQGGIAAVGQLQLLQPFFGLGLATTLLHEQVTTTMVAVSVAVVLCVFGAKKHIQRTHNDGKVRQLDVAVAVAYDTDLNQALATIREIVAANQHVLREPDPVIRTTLLGDSAVNIAMRPWVAIQDFGVARSEINQAILETFRSRGIVIPFPQREVRLIGRE